MRRWIFGLTLVWLNCLVVANAAEEAKEIDWDALIPRDFSMEDILERYDLREFDDSDPRAVEILAEIRAAWDAEPVVDDINGQYVKLPGFVVPLEMGVEKVREFLLVPYQGACIHVPPPPANQTVYVVTENPEGVEMDMFLPVWVTGKITTERVSSELAEAGYKIKATLVEPYEE